MNPVDLFLRARDLTAEVVASTSDEQWAASSPCAEWSVRDLTAHLVDEMLWVPELLAGKTIEDVGDAFAGDQLGEDPRARFAATSEVAAAAWRDLGSLDEIVHLSFGDVPAFVYATQMGTDMLVHGWDIARGIGRDHPLPEDLAETAYGLNSPMITPEVRAMGIFDAEVVVPDDAPWSHKLLGLLGRDPAWRAG